MILDIGEGAGKPSTVLKNSGHYEDMYIRHDGRGRARAGISSSQPGAQPRRARSRRVCRRRSQGFERASGTGRPHAVIVGRRRLRRNPAGHEPHTRSRWIRAPTGCDVREPVYVRRSCLSAAPRGVRGGGSTAKSPGSTVPGQGPLYLRNLVHQRPGRTVGRRGDGQGVHALVLDLGANGRRGRDCRRRALRGRVHQGAAEGWRISRREFIPSKTELQPPIERGRRDKGSCFRMRRHASCVCSSTLADSDIPRPERPRRRRTPDGAAVFQSACASCHPQPAADSRAPNTEALPRQFAPKRLSPP